MLLFEFCEIFHGTFFIEELRATFLKSYQYGNLFHTVFIKSIKRGRHVLKADSEDRMSYIEQCRFYQIVQSLVLNRIFYHHILVCSLELAPADIFLFKLNNKNTRLMCEICLKLTIKID